MHRIALALTMVAFTSLAACETDTSPTSNGPTTGTTLSSEDGAVCGCAAPDCKPNCDDLPACKLECSQESSLDWIDSCGGIQYAESCANGCVDASTPHCQ